MKTEEQNIKDVNSEVFNQLAERANSKMEVARDTERAGTQDISTDVWFAEFLWPTESLIEDCIAKSQRITANENKVLAKELLV